MLQTKTLLPKMRKLHFKYGDPNLEPIYGAGKIDKPKTCLIFMNPTARNITSFDHWNGIRAPWIGTKRIWKLLKKLDLMKDSKTLNMTQKIKPEDWTEEFALNLYEEVAQNSLYITNIAKCNFPDARHISNSIYKKFLPTTLEELAIIKPEKIIAFGNQVSSVLLGKNISVSNYLNTEHEIINHKNVKLKIFPTYYPVGQGARNIDKTISRIKNIEKAF